MIPAVPPWKGTPQQISKMGSCCIHKPMTPKINGFSSKLYSSLSFKMALDKQLLTAQKAEEKRLLRHSDCCNR